MYFISIFIKSSSLTNDNPSILTHRTLIIIITRFTFKVYQSRIFNYQNYSCLLYPMGLVVGMKRIREWNEEIQRKVARLVSRGWETLLCERHKGYVSMFIHSCITRYSGWRSGRGEFSTADKCDIAAATFSARGGRAKRRRRYIPLFFSREVAWTTRTEENFWANRKTRTPSISIPYRTCNFGERVFDARIFEAGERHRSPRKLEGKSRVVRPVWNHPLGAKINTRRFTVSKQYFFLSVQFRRRTARINWNNICRGLFS